MSYYKKELDALKKSNRLRQRKIYDTTSLVDMASNDYLGLSLKKKIFKKASKKVLKQKSFSPRASLLVNGYSTIHKKFEKKICKLNGFEAGIVVGSGFLANISLIESLIRKKDILFIDEDYHASGMLALKLVQGEVVLFKHNDFDDLEKKIIEYKKETTNRIIIAIEGVYSMSGDIAPKKFDIVASKYDAILLVDEAHSSGVIGENLLGWFDYHNINIKQNHIKMGTLGKAYGSYGAYILASSHIVSYLENRAKPIIYSTAPSIIDIAVAFESLKYIQKHKQQLKKKIKKFQNIVYDILEIKTESLILPIIIDDNKKVLELQKSLLEESFLIGAIREPTVRKAILRVILQLGIKKIDLKQFCIQLEKIKEAQNR